MNPPAGCEDGLPPTYFRDLAAVEDGHWWYRGMRTIAASLLGDRLGRGGPFLDAGCGTGGFLVWAGARGFSPLVGVDIAPEAIEMARTRAPSADLRVAPVWELPFAADSFAVVACNDVLQHVPEGRAEQSIGELRRVLRPGGALVVRTNGGRRSRRERSDWRVYDRAELRAALESAGLRCERISHVNTAGSLVALARGRVPQAPTGDRHGIPRLSRWGGSLRYGLLRAEAAALRLPGVGLPYGHTLVALATRSTSADTQSTTRSPVAAER